MDEELIAAVREAPRTMQSLTAAELVEFEDLFRTAEHPDVMAAAAPITRAAQNLESAIRGAHSKVWAATGRTAPITVAGADGKPIDVTP